MAVDFGLQNLDGYNSDGVADALMRFDGDPGALRPWLGRDGKARITVHRRGQPRNYVVNAPTALPYDAYKFFDSVIVEEARRPLVVWDDLQNSGLGRTIPNAMSYSVIQHQKMTSYQKAVLSMSPLRKGERARPQIEPVLMPLPIFHVDFSFDIREIMQARRAGWDLDTTQAEEGARSIGEDLEDLVVGTLGTYSYGGGTIYGLTNHPSRIVTTHVIPTTGGWTPAAAYNSILAHIKLLTDNNFGGPFGVYFSNDWWTYLNQDYSAAYPGVTLEGKVNGLRNIRWMKTLPRLAGYVILIVRLSRGTVQALTGLELQTLRWGTHGGMELNFKIMCIKLPRVMDNADGDAAILHSTGV
jgi:uncharacterized linocin/CFP29 family protein